MDLSDAVRVNSTRLKSVVWNDFDRFKKGDTCIAVCRHCKKRLSGSSSSGTSHLRNHLIRCQRRANHAVTQMYSARENKKETTLAIANFSFDQEQKKDEALSLVNIKFENEQMKDDAVNNGYTNFDQRRSQFDLARMIILHGYPLAMVEHVGFKLLVKNLQPFFELVPCSRVEADCMEIYEKEKQMVFERLDKLPGKISLSVDTWAALNDAKYLCLTAHYIDEDWQLKKKILNFTMVDPSHSEDMHSEVIMTSLMDWDIDRKLFSLTIDSFCTNDSIVSRIRGRLSQSNFWFCNSQLFDVQCAANIVKLMVQDALDALCNMIFKIRESIRYVRSSQATLEKFNGMTERLKVDSKEFLCLDNPLQWNSTYFMLDVALEHRDAFSLLQHDDPSYTMCPSDIEWDRAAAVTSYLKLFVEVTNVLTRSKLATANIYFPEICDIHLQLVEWCKSSDDYLSSLASKMRSKFDAYWEKCRLGLAVAAILDPRFKMKLVEYYFPQIYGDDASSRINSVSECVKGLYNEHSIGSPLASFDQSLAWQAGSSAGGAYGTENDARDRLIGFDKYLHETSQDQSIQSDLEKYLEEPLFPRNVEFGILNWWKVHTPRYPILSMMARNVLGIPMTKVATNTVFDIGDRMLDQDLSSLNPATVQALVCSRDWIQSELES